MNVPLAVSTELTGPDGTVIAPSTRPEMISLTLYSSSYTLDSAELADSGEYMCTVKIENEPEMYASTNITTGKIEVLSNSQYIIDKLLYSWWIVSVEAEECGHLSTSVQ